MIRSFPYMKNTENNKLYVLKYSYIVLQDIIRKIYIYIYIKINVKDIV